MLRFRKWLKRMAKEAAPAINTPTPTAPKDTAAVGNDNSLQAQINELREENKVLRSKFRKEEIDGCINQTPDTHQKLVRYVLENSQEPAKIFQYLKTQNMIAGRVKQVSQFTQAPTFRFGTPPTPTPPAGKTVAPISEDAYNNERMKNYADNLAKFNQ